MTTQSAEWSIPELTLGWRLRMALEASGVSRDEIAHEVGVDPKTVSRWTHDVGAPPKRAYILQWALKTGVPQTWLEHGVLPDDGDTPPGQRARRDSNSQPSDLEHGSFHARLRRSYASQLAAA
jgi:transcriptional regulator with XRE-family HTH domain